MLLNDTQIVEAVNSGAILLDPFDDRDTPDSSLQPASYDLRVGPQAITHTSKGIIDVREQGFVLFEPGDYGVVLSLEELRMDALHTARLGLTSTYARKGLVAIIGPQLDPGYHGRLFVHLHNLSPRAISLPYKEPFLTLEFHRLEASPRKLYSGPHQGRLVLGPEEIKAVTEAEAMPLPEVMRTLRSLSENVGSLTREVDGLTGNVRQLTGDVTQLTARMDTLATQFANITGELRNNSAQLTARLDTLSAQFAGVTGELRNNSAQLTTRFDALTTQFADLGGQLKGTRWQVPMLLSLVMSLAAVLISIVLSLAHH